MSTPLSILLFLCVDYVEKMLARSQIASDGKLVPTLEEIDYVLQDLEKLRSVMTKTVQQAKMGEILVNIF